MYSECHPSLKNLSEWTFLAIPSSLLHCDEVTLISLSVFTSPRFVDRFPTTCIVHGMNVKSTGGGLVRQFSQFLGSSHLLLQSDSLLVTEENDVTFGNCHQLCFRLDKTCNCKVTKKGVGVGSVNWSGNLRPAAVVESKCLKPSNDSVYFNGVYWILSFTFGEMEVTRGRMGWIIVGDIAFDTGDNELKVDRCEPETDRV